MVNNACSWPPWHDGENDEWLLKKVVHDRQWPIGVVIMAYNGVDAKSGSTRIKNG